MAGLKMGTRATIILVLLLTGAYSAAAAVNSSSAAKLDVTKGGLDQPAGSWKVSSSQQPAERWTFKGYVLGRNKGNDPAALGVFMSEVIRLDNGTYRMFYGSAVNGGLTSIRYADSSDGVNFTFGGIALSGSSNQSDRDAIISGPSVVKLPDGRYRMYYQSCQKIEMGQRPKFHVRSAISNDATTWTPEGIRIDIKEYDARSPLQLAGHGTYFIASDGTVVGLFPGEAANSTGPSDIYMASSADGLTFSNFRKLYEDWHDPIVVNKGGQYMMYATYLVEKQGKAVSADGLNWPSQPTDVSFEDQSGNAMTEGSCGVGDFGGVLLPSGAIRLYANYGSQQSSTDIVYFELSESSIDSSPPTTSISLSPIRANGLNSWYKTKPTISFSVSEASTTYFRIDSGVTRTYSAPFKIFDGLYTIRYWSVDWAGNTESAKGQTVKVDTKAPNLAIYALASGRYVKGYLKIKASSSDPSTGGGCSGLKKIQLYCDKKLIATRISSPLSIRFDTRKVKDGKHTFKLIATDKAGNSRSSSRYYKIDNHPRI